MRVLNQQQQNNSNSSAPATTTVVTSRRPVCAAEVFVLADALRKSRSVEFSLPQSLAVAEVRLLHYLRNHGDFVRRQGEKPERAAEAISTVVSAIRDLCSVPCSPTIQPVTSPTAAGATASNNNNNNFSQCVLTEDELIQLVDLRVLTEVDLYKVIPDIDVRLGGESKIAALLNLLQQLK